MTYDFCVIGGGIVGLATALDLLRRSPGATLLLLEKEADVATHQTGHNSGVIHAGIYYAPGSLKAQLCREGAVATKGFCRENGIPFEECGKLLVATNEREERAMDALEERAQLNQIAVERLDAHALRQAEPGITGRGALLVRSTGIVDYKHICRVMCAKLRELGADIRFASSVTSIKETSTSVTLLSGELQFQASRLVVCAGLQSDRIAAMAGLKLEHRIIPFRGEYYGLPAARNDLIRHLIYPIPDPDLPFLGVHLTKMIDGSITVGPNAVLGLSREGYGRGTVSLRDLGATLAFPGFWRLVRKHWRTSIEEARDSLWKRGYLERCKKFCPSLTLGDLQPYPAGIRAQAVGRDGTLVHDFLFRQTDRMLHVINAPSPAATAAIPIGRMIADRLVGLDRIARAISEN